MIPTTVRLLDEGPGVTQSAPPGAHEPERGRWIGHRVGYVRGYSPLPGVWVWRFYLNADGTRPLLMRPWQSIDAF